MLTSWWPRRITQRTGITHLSLFKSEQRAGLRPLPPHATDSVKATAIAFTLFILSQDCVVIYTVNTENTLYLQKKDKKVYGNKLDSEGTKEKKVTNED